MSRLLYFISLFNILTNHLTFVDKFYETKDFTKKKKIYIFLQDIFYYNRTQNGKSNRIDMSVIIN